MHLSREPSQGLVTSKHKAVCLLLLLFTNALFGDEASSRLSPDQPDVTGIIINADFQTGNLNGWNKHWATRRTTVIKDPKIGRYVAAIGPEMGNCIQEVRILPNSRYRLSAVVRTDTGSEEVRLGAQNFGGEKITVSSALTDYNEISLEFTSAYTVNTFEIVLMHPSGGGKAYIQKVELEYLGEAREPEIQEFMPLTERRLLEEGGVIQLPDEEVDWFLDARFGMFIHWGLYACMDEGNEWVMHNQAYTHEEYRVRGEDPESGFTADRFNPGDWAKLAKKAGMKYMVLTARHHDGYALFETGHPQGWSSVKHLGRDLIQEYTSAVRDEGLRVGVYYSPMSWRYPGYYNVTGDDMKPNNWGYKAEPWHRENARVMKEEVYEQLKNLLTNYGKIDYLWWDGAWLGQTIGHEMEDLFWDTGRYQNRDGAGLKWVVDEKYVDRDDEGLSLGIMGMVRKYQPTALTNERFSWIGDIHIEEGGATPAGKVRTERLSEKCTSLQMGGWGYSKGRPLYPAKNMITVLSGCAVRNANFLLNIAPNRHGEIPMDQQEALIEIGEWLAKNGEGVYKTRGGPWQPLFGEYGFTYRENKIYCHIYPGYRSRSSETFTTQSIGEKEVLAVRSLTTGEELKWNKNDNNTVTVSGVAVEDSPVTVVEVTLNENVYP